MTVSTDEIARWLYKKLMNDGELSHRQALHHVRERYGEAYLTVNENGSPALDPDVLRTFRRYIHGKAEWNRDDAKWRLTGPRVADDDE
jgi:hypothetical protein